MACLVALGAATLQTGCDRKPSDPPKPSRQEPSPPRPQTTVPGTQDPAAPASPPPSSPAANR
jgi:hypothetical protein